MLPSDVVRGRRNPLHLGLAFRLKRARGVACLSFDSVAAAAGLTDGNTVFQIERKAGHVPRIDTVERIAKALALSPGFLAFGLAGDYSTASTLRSDEVGARLRGVRTDRGLTMRALARLAGLTDTAVRTTENGDTVPTLATVEAFADALGLSPAWLAYGVGPQLLPARRKARTTQPDARG